MIRVFLLFCNFYDRKKLDTFWWFCKLNNTTRRDDFRRSLHYFSIRNMTFLNIWLLTDCHRQIKKKVRKIPQSTNSSLDFDRKRKNSIWRKLEFHRKIQRMLLNVEEMPGGVRLFEPYYINFNFVFMEAFACSYPEWLTRKWIASI